MEKKLNVFDYLTQVFTIFGILILILNIFCLLFGESAKEYSTIFSLGDTGLSITTMLQFLFAIAIITAIKFLFMTDYIIKSLSMTIRIILLFMLILIQEFVLLISIMILFLTLIKDIVQVHFVQIGLYEMEIWII